MILIIYSETNLRKDLGRIAVNNAVKSRDIHLQEAQHSTDMTRACHRASLKRAKNIIDLCHLKLQSMLFLKGNINKF